MMALFRIVGKNAVRWRGEPIKIGRGKSTRHPFNIERLWSDEELAKAGLHRPAPPDPIPEGKVEVERAVKVVDGRPKVVLTLADRIPPTADQALKDRARRLRETDFWYLSDTPKPPAGMKEYRQALRDVTKQPGFPSKIDWPSKPTS